MKKFKPSTPRRRRAYAVGQHDLICDALKMPNDGAAPGASTYEAVCVLLTKLAAADAALAKVKTAEARRTRKYLKAHHDSETFCVLQVTGW